MKLIVGLGNPGKEYEGTRHNAGWMCVEALAKELGVTFQEKSKFHAYIAETMINGEKLILVLPTTFMNRSGDTVSALLSFYKATTGDLLVVQDEMDYEPGTFAFLQKGGFAGHNGIASIAERLGVEAFARLRIGIGRAKPPIKSEDYVLGVMTSSERASFDDQMEALINAMKDWAIKGIDKAMNVWNVVKSAESKRVD